MSVRIILGHVLTDDPEADELNNLLGALTQPPESRQAAPPPQVAAIGSTQQLARQLRRNVLLLACYGSRRGMVTLKPGV